MPKKINTEIAGTKPMTLAQVKTALKTVPKAAQPGVVCVLVGHSKIQTACFGYYSCERCGTQVGDSLASVYPAAATVVVLGHDCKTCRANAKKLTWKDTFLMPAKKLAQLPR